MIVIFSFRFFLSSEWSCTIANTYTELLVFIQNGKPFTINLTLKLCSELVLQFATKVLLSYSPGH